MKNRIELIAALMSLVNQAVLLWDRVSERMQKDEPSQCTTCEEDVLEGQDIIVFMTAGQDVDTIFHRDCAVVNTEKIPSDELPDPEDDEEAIDVPPEIIEVIRKAVQSRLEEDGDSLEE